MPARLQTFYTNFVSLFSVPPFPYTYFWNFMTVTKNVVPGAPSLYMFGKYILKDLGLLFLESTWSQTEITRTDGLLDPEKLTGGFTIVIKLKFDPDIKNCNTPRFIVDTGATSLNTRGLSVYTLSGKIIAVVTTSKTTWKVGVVFIRSKHLIKSKRSKYTW